MNSTFILPPYLDGNGFHHRPLTIDDVDDIFETCTDKSTQDRPLCQLDRIIPNGENQRGTFRDIERYVRDI